MRRDYADFDLVFHQGGSGSYSVEVSNSPVGETVGVFQIPFSDQDLELFLLRIGHTRGATRRVDSPEMKATRAFGSRLFGAVFGGRVGTLLERSLDEADRNEQGLRVRLHLAETPELGDLPWEFVYSEDLGRFLATSTETPVVRYIDLPRPVRPLTITAPLRILVWIASPSDHRTLDVGAEWRRLEAALRDLGERGLVELRRVRDGSLQSLQQELRRGDYHVLHFIGHGAFDKAIDDGVLILEDERRRGRKVGGEDLGMILHDHRSLRLVVLNSCEGARSSRTDPFSGTGKSLVQQGIPAVVAMQFEISDAAAIQFAREFYESIADGFPVDAAMGEARKALFGGGVEWGTPVLYMRAPDGRIFNVEDAVPVADPSQREVGPTVDPSRLAHLLDMARTSMDAEDWATAVSRLEDVLRLDPDNAEAHESLPIARAHERVARMYGSAQLLFEARQWQAVVDRIEQIRLSEPGFDDPDQLEQQARNTLSEEVRAARLLEWYRDATAAFEAGEWEVSIELLERITAEAPDYEDAAGLLAEATARLESAQLLAEAGEAIADERWQAALDRFTEMERLGIDYVQDPEGWRQLASDQIAEQQQEHKLDALYDTALALMEGEGWDEASRIIDMIEGERPGYRGIDTFRTRIYEAHARLVEEERLREIDRDKATRVRLAEDERRREIERQEEEAHARLVEEEGRLREIERLNEEAHARAEEERLREIEREQGEAPAARGRRLELPPTVIVTVGALALLAVIVLFVIPGLFGGADGGSDAAPEATAAPSADDGGVGIGVVPATTFAPTTAPTTDDAGVGIGVVPATTAPVPDVTFDADHTSGGLWLAVGGDVDTEIVAIGSPGEQAWRSGNGRVLPASDGNTVEDGYMLFDIDDDFIYRGSPTSEVTIEVEFLDEGTDTFNLQYDSMDSHATPQGRFKDSEFVTKTGTDGFETAVFVLSDAYFGNRTHAADFRISDRFDGAETVRRVTVTLYNPSDRVMAVYYSGWEDSTTHASCCDYWPLHVVEDWADPDQLYPHFAWLRQARVGVIAYSWWGQGSDQDRNLPAVLEAAGRYGIEVAFLLEPYDGRSAGTLVDDVAYIYAQYESHSAFHWTRESTRSQQNDDPKGLFLLWGSDAGEGGTNVADRPTYWEPAVTAIHNLPQGGVILGNVGPDWIDPTGFDGVYKYTDPTDEMDFSWASDLPSDAWYVPSVLPGFERENQGDLYAYEPRRSGSYYERWWRAAFDPNVRPDRIIVGSFNNWFQGTQIEPVTSGIANDQGFTYKDYGDLGPEGYLDLTASWVTELLERFP